MKKYLTALLISAFAALSVAHAAEPEEMSAFDYLLDGEDLVGKAVQINDCVASSVSTMFFFCTVETKTGMAGMITVNVDNLPKRQLAYGLRECGDFIGTKASTCSVTITGVGAKDILGEPELEAHQVKWHAEQ